MPYDATKDTNQTNSMKTKDGVGARAVIVTPGAADLDSYAKVVEVVTEGDLVYLPTMNADANTITVTAAPVGYRTPTNVRRVLAGTTATVVAIYD